MDSKINLGGGQSLVYECTLGLRQPEELVLGQILLVPGQSLVD